MSAVIRFGGVTSAEIDDGEIVNADVSATAAIAASKINPAGWTASHTWTEGTSTPTFTHTARTTDAATTGMIWVAQAPFATATGTNRNSGGFEYKIAAAVSGGTQGSFVVEFAGTDRFTITESSGVTQINVPGSGSLLRASSTKLAWDANGVVVYGTFTTSSSVGFNGAAAYAKPTISGSRGGNAALADLLTKLATYGLITDGTSA